jgi:hypothetical protein
MPQAENEDRSRLIIGRRRLGNLVNAVRWGYSG